MLHKLIAEDEVVLVKVQLIHSITSPDGCADWNCSVDNPTIPLLLGKCCPSNSVPRALTHLCPVARRNPCLHR